MHWKKHLRINQDLLHESTQHKPRFFAAARHAGVNALSSRHFANGLKLS